jgi:C4-dicarboxylate-specific signal transduction histidine kinase
MEAWFRFENSAAPIRDRRDRVIGVVLVFRDATNERKTQRLLRETERLTSAAKMPAAVADESNNPLEAMTNLIFLAKGTSGATPEVVETLQMAEHELARVSMIAERTLGFYREYKVPEQIDLPRVIDNVLTLYSGKLSSKNLFVTRDLKPCPTIVGIEGGCGRLSRTSCQTPSTQLQPMEEFISLARPMSPEST